MLGARVQSSLLHSLTPSIQPPSQNEEYKNYSNEYAVNISQVSSLEQLILTRIRFILQPFYSISISVSLFHSVTEPSISF